MSENRVSASLGEAERTALLGAIANLKSSLPFLIDLTPEERRALPKLGDKSRAFVSKALEVAIQNEDILPRSFDLEEFKRDVALFESLYPVLIAIAQLNELIEDTVLEVGSEAYAAALLVYNYAKANGKGSGLDGVVDELGKRFARKSSKGAPPPSV